MKLSKKIAAGVLAAVLAVSAVGCNTIGGDKSWAAKDGSLTVPIGAYIYYMYSANLEAQSKVPDATKPILDQKIEDKDAKQWIQDKAVGYVKSLLFLNSQMKERSLSFTDDDKAEIQTNTEQQWANQGAQFEGYGIAKSSYSLAFTEYQKMYGKLFYSLYGKGGEKEVKEADLKEYFEKNYTDFDYLMSMPYDQETGEAFDDEKKKELKAKLDEYTSKVSAGEMTMRQAADAYKEQYKLTENTLYGATENFSGSTAFPTEIIDALGKMKAGEATCIEVLGTYVILAKKDVAQKSATELADGSTTHNNLLIDLKGDEFTKYIEEQAAGYTCELNNNAINAYSPKMFQSTISSAPSSEAASSETASSEASSSEASSSEASSSEASSN